MLNTTANSARERLASAISADMMLVSRELSTRLPCKTGETRHKALDKTLHVMKVVYRLSGHLARNQ